jgi:hypothetical protein
MKCLYACVEKLFGNAGACREGGVKIRRDFFVASALDAFFTTVPEPNRIY